MHYEIFLTVTNSSNAIKQNRILVIVTVAIFFSAIWPWQSGILVAVTHLQNVIEF